VRESIEKRLRAIVRNRLLQHVLFWALSFYILLRVFTDPGEYPAVDILYTGLFHITLWIVVYPNLTVLIPRLLQKERYIYYLLSLSLLVFAGVLFNILFFDKLVDFVFAGYYFISYYEFVDILQFFIAYVAITSLIKLSRSWFKVLEQEKEVAILSEENKIAELKALKAQVNPHFLFNNLNNIYGQTLKADAKAPETIVKLSNVLRYMIYEAENERTKLKNELDYIRDYLELEKIRNEKLTINYVIKGQPETHQVAPLLFIPFIENAFKYCSRSEGSFVEVRFDISKNIEFEIKNSVDRQRLPGAGGLGIRNVKRRLELQYPQAHELRIDDVDNIFNVFLRIDG
jgi:sensor histidine kinase YesM